jgi:hypothetical protein
METNSNYSTNGGAKTTEKMLNDSTKEITDFYTKQLNAATSIYKNMFNSFSNGNKGWSSTPDFSKGFLNNDLKPFAMPFNGMSNNFTNPFLPNFDTLFKQMNDYSKAMFSNLNNELKGNTDMSVISSKYQETVNARIESFKNILNATTEAYTKQLDFSMENNKKAMEEMNIQLNAMVNQNQKFWSEITGPQQTPEKNEEKIVKDSISPEIKKRTSIPVNEFSDHKA